jgi:hypothetical protein
MSGLNDKVEENDKKEQTPFQKFQALARGLVQVPKAEVEQKIRAERARRNKRSSPSRKSGK